MAAAIYGFWVRPRLWRWGATDEEVAGPYPGAELVPEGERAATMAVTIEAPADQIWPWLVQMGGDRGGWYSWDRLDNGGRPSAQEVRPEWQDLALGDHVKYWTAAGPVDAWEVAALEPNRFLGLRGLTDLRGGQARSEATAAIGLHRRALGLPVERTAWRAHTPGHRRLPGHPPTMGWTFRLLLVVHPGRLDHAGTYVGRAQAKHRTSGQRTDAAGDAGGGCPPRGVVRAPDRAAHMCPTRAAGCPQAREVRSGWRRAAAEPGKQCHRSLPEGFRAAAGG